MSKRILIVVVTVVAAILAINLMGVTDSEGGWGWGWGGYKHHPKPPRNIPINWKVSGTLANVQLYFNPPPEDTIPPPPELQLGILIQAVLKGIPGDGQFTVISIPDPTQPFDPSLCGGGPGLMIKHNDMVITLADLSMIFAEPDTGWLCFTGPTTVTAKAHMIITGGTGKYKDASGDFTGTFFGQLVGTSGSLQAESGTIVGEIER